MLQAPHMLDGMVLETICQYKNAKTVFTNGKQCWKINTSTYNPDFVCNPDKKHLQYHIQNVADTTHVGWNGIGNNLPIQECKNSVLPMATNVEKLVHPLTTLTSSSILYKNKCFSDAKPLNDDISLSNTIAENILVQCGWKVIDHGWNWDVENVFHIPKKRRSKILLELLSVNTKYQRSFLKVDLNWRK